MQGGQPRQCNKSRWHLILCRRRFTPSIARFASEPTATRSCPELPVVVLSLPSRPVLASGRRLLPSEWSHRPVHPPTSREMGGGPFHLASGLL